MSNQVKVMFQELPWEEPGAGVRFKAFTRDGKRIRLVEFTKEFIEQDWCKKGLPGNSYSNSRASTQFLDG